MTAQPPSHLPIEVDRVFGCWTWVGKLDQDGYGRHQGRLAHLSVWEALRGEIPDGLEADHLCRRRACARPVHLEFISRSRQEQRKVFAVRFKRKTCPEGHSMEENAMVTEFGGRVCRTCSKGAKP